MKNSLMMFLVSILFLSSLSAQETTDTTYLLQIDSVTFADIHINYDSQGREIRRTYAYVDSSGLNDRLFDQTVNSDNQLFQSETIMINDLRNFNQLKQLFAQYSGQSYTLALTERKKEYFAGDWKIRIGTDLINVNSSPNNAVLIKDDNSQRMRILYNRNNLIRLTASGANTPFFANDVYLEERVINGKSIWVGRTEVDNVLIRLFK